jgi:two-component system nitrogen regulation response regulator NtrX
MNKITSLNTTKKNTYTILVIDDNHSICDMIADILSDEGYNVIIADNIAKAYKQLEHSPSLVILDICLGHNINLNTLNINNTNNRNKKSDNNEKGVDPVNLVSDGIGLLKSIKKEHPDMPIIMISGHAGVELAAATIKLGADDFIEKPFTSERVLLAVKQAMQIKNLLDLNRYFYLQNSQIYNDLILAGNSKIVNKLDYDIKNAANSNSRIIITGPYGSDHTNVAAMIHYGSNRAKKPFIVISPYSHKNLTSYIKGDDKTPSIFEHANYGSIVLENLNEFPITLQSFILEVLHKEQIVRNNIVYPINIRVMATINAESEHDLNKMIKDKVLNEVLYHRLNIKNINLPALKTRSEDMQNLIEWMVNNSNLNSKKFRIAQKVYHILASYDWPGNIFELRNVVESILIAGYNSKIHEISISQLPSYIMQNINADFGNLEQLMNILDKNYPYAKKQFEIFYIKAQLRKCGNNVAKTARLMGIDRAALYRKIRGFSLLHQSNKKIKNIVKEVDTIDLIPSLAD